MTLADMPRFLIRAGSVGDWMVWDRLRRGPAVVDERKLVRLSREAAERALAALLAAAAAPNPAEVNAPPKWQIVHGRHIIDCGDEQEAKMLARTLIRRRAKIVARMTSAGRVLRAIERQDLRAWLSK